MARKKSEFRPDTVQEDTLGKLLMTRRQWQRTLKWLLFSAVCLGCLLLQDVILSRFGIPSDLVACCILAVCVLQGAHSGCVFVLLASLIYYYSGSAPGVYCIPLLTFIAVFATIFRQNFLSQGIFTLLLCTVMGMVVYELGVFAVEAFVGNVSVNRIGYFLLTAFISAAFLPVLYPIFAAIGKIGGEVWKE